MRDHATVEPEPDWSTTPLPGVRFGTRGPAVVLVHGFTQTRASWTVVAQDLAHDHRVLVVDIPGHGEAGRQPADLISGAARLGAAGGRAIYIGYSMGGRLALRLALDRPGLVAGLVLIGATAGIEDRDDRRDRRRADEILAQEIERGGVKAFLDRWLAQPLFKSLTVDPLDLAARRANRPAGLADALRLAGTGTMDPAWWEDLSRVRASTLVLAGQRDAKFTALGQRLAAGIGSAARFETIAAAGHAAHLQDPAATCIAIRQLTGVPPAQPNSSTKPTRRRRT